ncbi:MAG: nitrogen regulation protein NR(II) [Halobacteriaceae archaeon]
MASSSGADPLVLALQERPSDLDGVARRLHGEGTPVDVEAVGDAGALLDRLEARPSVACVIANRAVVADDPVDFFAAVRDARPTVPLVLYAGRAAAAADAIAAAVTASGQSAEDATRATALSSQFECAADSRPPDATRGVEVLREGVCVLDADGLVTHASQGYLDVTDEAGDAVPGAPWEPPVPGEDPDALLLEVLPDGAENGGGAAARTGGLVLVASAVTTAGDSADGAAPLATEYQALIETVPDGVYVLDGELRFVMVNESMVELTGYDREDLLGSHVSLLFDEGDTEAAREQRARMAAGETEVGVLETTIRTADGERVPCEVRGRFLPVDDESGRYTTGVFRDVSEQKRREAELERQTERLEEFASVLAHDLRNPLNVLEIALERAAETGDPEHFERGQDMIDRMDELIGDVLTMARQGETIEETSPVDLGDLVRACWQNVETGRATLVAETDATIEADESRLRRVFENLIRNAVDHAGPDVTVRVGDLDGGFYVADDGPGVPPDERDAVFESGYSTSAEGTGFGLPIVEEIAEAHGWTIDLTESDAGGARFEVTGVDVA